MIGIIEMLLNQDPGIIMIIFCAVCLSCPGACQMELFKHNIKIEPAAMELFHLVEADTDTCNSLLMNQETISLGEA